MVIISLLVRNFEFSARPRKGESEIEMRERLVRAVAKVRSLSFSLFCEVWECVN